MSGTTIGRDDRPWLVGVHPYQVEIELDSHMVVMLNDDRPGMIGRVGTLLGEEGANIANMNVSRNVRGEEAVMVLSVDTRARAARARAAAGRGRNPLGAGGIADRPLTPGARGVR